MSDYNDFNPDDIFDNFDKFFGGINTSSTIRNLDIILINNNKPTRRKLEDELNNVEDPESSSEDYSVYRRGERAENLLDLSSSSFRELRRRSLGKKDYPSQRDNQDNNISARMNNLGIPKAPKKSKLNPDDQIEANETNPNPEIKDDSSNRNQIRQRYLLKKRARTQSKDNFLGNSYIDLPQTNSLNLSKDKQGLYQTQSHKNPKNSQKEKPIKKSLKKFSNLQKIFKENLVKNSFKNFGQFIINEKNNNNNKKKRTFSCNNTKLETSFSQFMKINKDKNSIVEKLKRKRNKQFQSLISGREEFGEGKNNCLMLQMSEVERHDQSLKSKNEAKSKSTRAAYGNPIKFGKFDPVQKLEVQLTESTINPYSSGRDPKGSERQEIIKSLKNGGIPWNLEEKLRKMDNQANFKSTKLFRNNSMIGKNEINKKKDQISTYREKNEKRSFFKHIDIKKQKYIENKQKYKENENFKEKDDYKIYKENKNKTFDKSIAQENRKFNKSIVEENRKFNKSIAEENIITLKNSLNIKKLNNHKINQRVKSQDGYKKLKGYLQHQGNFISNRDLKKKSKGRKESTFIKYNGKSDRVGEKKERFKLDIKGLKDLKFNKHKKLKLSKRLMSARVSKKLVEILMKKQKLKTEEAEEVKNFEEGYEGCENDYLDDKLDKVKISRLFNQNPNNGWMKSKVKYSDINSKKDFGKKNSSKFLYQDNNNNHKTYDRAEPKFNLFDSKSPKCDPNLNSGNNFEKEKVDLVEKFKMFQARAMEATNMNK